MFWSKRLGSIEKRLESLEMSNSSHTKELYNAIWAPSMEELERTREYMKANQINYREIPSYELISLREAILAITYHFKLSFRRNTQTYSRIYLKEESNGK